MAKNENKTETVLLLTPGRGKRKGLGVAKSNTLDASKVYDMRSRRLVQRLREEVLGKLIDYDKLQILVSLLENTLDRSAHQLRTVENRDYDANSWIKLLLSSVHGSPPKSSFQKQLSDFSPV